MNPLITPAAAEEIILRDLAVVDSVTIPIDEAPRHILAEPLRADRPLPPYDRVMMDGIACRLSNVTATHGRLRIAGLHPAGAPDPGPLAAGHCWEIMTGAVLPADCDVVVPYEEGRKMDDEFRIANVEGVLAGQNIHRAGSDFPAGAELVPAGRALGPRELAVAATVGQTTLAVRSPLRVTIVTTGDELIPPDETPLPHQVRRSNGHALLAALASWGVCDVTCRHSPDDEAQLGKIIDESLPQSDLLLLCGGISKGKRDYVRPLLEDRCGAPSFHGIAQRPGKPLAFWPNPLPVFALPGNPMSVLVTFHRYVLPAMAAMNGLSWSRRRVALADQVTFPRPIAYHLPVSLDESGGAIPAPLANSGDFASAIPSDGFIELPPGPGDFPPGFEAPFLRWL